MNATIPVTAAALSAAIDRDEPSPPKALLELLPSILLGAVIAGLVRACNLHLVGGVGLWL